MNLPPLSILSFGALTPLGRDLDTIQRALSVTGQTLFLKYSPDTALELEKQNSRPSRPEKRQSREAGQELDTSHGSWAKKVSPRLGGASPASPENCLRVDDSILWIDPALGAQLRRADRFTRMAVAAATDAWTAAQDLGGHIPPERIGLFLASGFGPHCRGFKFLDGILDAGDTAASPTDFSHSVHGAASAYISRLLDLRGPSLNTTDFEIGFEESVRVAQCWLSENACDRVLIGAVEELGKAYLYCASRLLADREEIIPGEGAVFMVLARSEVPGIAKLDATASPAIVDLAIVEDPVIQPTTEVRQISARRTVCFTRCFGHSASATAFNLLGGLLTMREEPDIHTAATLRTSSEGRSVNLLLEK